MNKQTKLIAAITIISPILGLSLLLSWVPQHTERLIQITQENPTMAPLVLISWRIIGIIIPPIPGGIVSIALIPVFGWFWSFVYAAVGVLVGSSIAFLLARRFREPLVKRFVPLQQMHQWEDKFTKDTKFMTFLAIRFTTGPILDFISYVAGLTKISYKNFFLTTAITLLPDAFYYYVGEEVYKRNTPVAIVGIIVFISVFYILQKAKFFEKTKEDKELQEET